MAPLPSEGNRALLLNLTLVPDGLNAQQIGTIDQYCGVNGAAISRQILVPDKMRLHSLHYAIQSAFGLLNEHPHRFALTQSDFLRLTNQSFQEWQELVGLYFRPPDAPAESYYQTDKVPANQTYQTWLRNRYRGPYAWDIGAFFEHLVSARLYLDSLMAQPEYDEDEVDEDGNPVPLPPGPDWARMTLPEASLIFHDDLKTLIERIYIGQLFAPPGVELADQRAVDRMVGRAEVAFHVGQHITYPITVEISMQSDQYSATRPPLDALELQDRYERVLSETDISVRPAAHSIDYFYDPEGGWHIRIDCEETYEMVDYEPGTIAELAYEVVDQTGRHVPEEAYSAVAGVILDNRPICTSAAGPALLDNVGGPEGFARFLSDLHGRKPQPRLEATRTQRANNWSRHAPDASRLL